MKGPQGSLRGRWEHVKACLSKNWCQGPILTPGAKMNEHQATFMNIRWGVTPPPHPCVYLPLVYVPLSCCCTSEDTESFTPRGMESFQTAFKSNMSQRLLEFGTKLQKKTFRASTVGTGVENFVFTIFYIFLSLSLHPPIGEAWLASQ